MEAATLTRRSVIHKDPYEVQWTPPKAWAEVNKQGLAHQLGINPSHFHSYFGEGRRMPLTVLKAIYQVVPELGKPKFANLPVRKRKQPARPSDITWQLARQFDRKYGDQALFRIEDPAPAPPLKLHTAPAAPPAPPPPAPPIGSGAGAERATRPTRRRTAGEPKPAPAAAPVAVAPALALPADVVTTFAKTVTQLSVRITALETDIRQRVLREQELDQENARLHQQVNDQLKLLEEYDQELGKLGQPQAPTVTEDERQRALEVIDERAAADPATYATLRELVGALPNS